MGTGYSSSLQVLLPNAVAFICVFFLKRSHKTREDELQLQGQTSPRFIRRMIQISSRGSGVGR